MANDLFGEVIVDAKPREYRGALPEPDTTWMVATWYAPDRRWKLWPEQWGARESAEVKAMRIQEKVRGHTHYVILEIRLPGVSRHRACVECGAETRTERNESGEPTRFVCECGHVEWVGEHRTGG